MSLLSDDEIEALANVSRDPSGGVWPHNFAQTLQAEIIAKLASAELPEPYGWAKQSEIEQSARFGGSINLWREKFNNDTAFYTADQLRQAYAQGAASQLAEKPSGFLSPHNLEMLKQGYPQTIVMLEGAKRDVPLFTLKEPK